jgi:hypothetical protein
MEFFFIYILTILLNGVFSPKSENKRQLKVK